MTGHLSRGRVRPSCRRIKIHYAEYMNARLETAIAQLGELAQPQQERLADLLMDLMAHVQDSSDPTEHFSAAELAELEVISTEPFLAADPAQVEGLFARHAL